MRRPWRAGWAFLTIGLTGCAALFGEDVQPPCPSAITIADAQTMTAHRPGPGRDLTDIVNEGAITGVATDCNYDDEGRVEATVKVFLDVSLGPAAPNNVGRWDYFVTVVNPDKKIVAKQIFTIDLQFEQAVFRTRLEEAVTSQFTYAPWPDASKYTIFVGFQLTREQLEYLRSLKR